MHSKHHAVISWTTRLRKSLDGFAVIDVQITKSSWLYIAPRCDTRSIRQRREEKRTSSLTPSPHTLQHKPQNLMPHETTGPNRNKLNRVLTAPYVIHAVSPWNATAVTVCIYQCYTKGVVWRLRVIVCHEIFVGRVGCFKPLHNGLKNVTHNRIHYLQVLSETQFLELIIFGEIIAWITLHFVTTGFSWNL